MHLKIPFYLLGLLIRYGPQYGYKLKQIITDEISDFAHMKLPTIYYHLKSMEQSGLVSSSLDREGNRPERTTYTITELGEKHFKNLLNKFMDEKYTSEFGIDGIFYFFDSVDSNVMIQKLIAKKNNIEKLLQWLAKHENDTMETLDDSVKSYSKIIFQHHIYHLQAELKWLEATIKELS